MRRMKMEGLGRKLLVAAGVTVVMVSAADLVGCLAAKQIAKSAIDVALAACIQEHPDADEPELKELCKWTDDLAPLVKELLSARSKAAKRMGAKACVTAPSGPQDAGKD